VKKLLTIMVSFILVISLSTSVLAFNPSHENLITHTNEEQKLVLGLGVAMFGYTCSFPKSVFFQGFDEEETAYWNLLCDDGTFRIKIKNDEYGSLDIVPCSELGPDKVPCFKPFK